MKLLKINEIDLNEPTRKDIYNILFEEKSKLKYYV